jgi:hypothetical protein
MAKTTKTTFEKLSAINVNDKVEKKNGLTYLSWAWAWSEVKKVCPDATYVELPTEFDDQLGFMCRTEVTIEGETLGMWLPVMDGANKAMKKTAYSYSTRYGKDKTVEPATAFDINKTLMRCLVKNLAMFGLGIYIYAGEDMPENVEPPKPKAPKPKAPTPIPTIDVTSKRWKGLMSFAVQNKTLPYDDLIKKLELSGKCKLSEKAKAEVEKLSTKK